MTPAIPVYPELLFPLALLLLLAAAAYLLLAARHRRLRRLATLLDRNPPPGLDQESGALVGSFHGRPAVLRFAGRVFRTAYREGEAALSVSLKCEAPLSFRVQREWPTAWFERKLGLVNDAQTGDPELDREFVFESSDEALWSACIRRPDVRNEIRMLETTLGAQDLSLESGFLAAYWRELPWAGPDLARVGRAFEALDRLAPSVEDAVVDEGRSRPATVAPPASRRGLDRPPPPPPPPVDSEEQARRASAPSATPGIRELTLRALSHDWGSEPISLLARRILQAVVTLVGIYFLVAVMEPTFGHSGTWPELQEILRGRLVFIFVVAILVGFLAAFLAGGNAFGWGFCLSWPLGMLALLVWGLFLIARPWLLEEIQSGGMADAELQAGLEIVRSAMTLATTFPLVALVSGSLGAAAGSLAGKLRRRRQTVVSGPPSPFARIPRPSSPPTRARTSGRPPGP